MELDSVLSELRARVRVRRARGDYPVGLEAQLEAEFNALLATAHQSELILQPLSTRLEVMDHRIAAVTTVEPELSSRVPGGSKLHALASRVVRRQTSALALATRDLGQVVRDSFNEVVRLFEVQQSADERRLNEVIGAVFDRLAVLDALVEAVADLERRLDELERATTSS